MGYLFTIPLKAEDFVIISLFLATGFLTNYCSSRMFFSGKGEEFRKCRHVCRILRDADRAYQVCRYITVHNTRGSAKSNHSPKLIANL